MKYITGIQALNVRCQLNTTGDWHSCAIRWESLTLAESRDSFFGDYGIEPDKTIPEHTERYAVANHIRAVLDLLYRQDFSNAQGMRNDYIGTEEYTDEIFDKVWLMRPLSWWNRIHDFMQKEYRMEWICYAEARGEKNKTVTLARTLSLENVENSLRTMSVNQLVRRKIIDYAARDAIADLYDLIYLCKHYWECISCEEQSSLANVFAYKGLAYVEYLLCHYDDEGIAKEKLWKDFLALYGKLGLLIDETELEEIARRGRLDFLKVTSKNT